MQISKFTFKRINKSRNNWKAHATANNKTAMTNETVISKIAAVMVEKYQSQEKEETDAS